MKYLINFNNDFNHKPKNIIATYLYSFLKNIRTMSTIKLANPAVVGLGGFGLTTLLLQFHNLGFIGLGPVVAMGFVFGGLAQMIAGFLEQKLGNNFGFAAIAIRSISS